MTMFRRATLSELAEVLDWAAQEGWNPGLGDAEAFYAADPHGFFVAHDETGRLLASISVVNHTTDFAFLGLYIVRPEYRGQGIGLGLWQHAIQHAGDRTIGLDGVEAQQSNYSASGFLHAGGTTRYSGATRSCVSPHIRAATSDDIPALITLEAAASGVAKPDYLRAWFTGATTRTTIVSERSDGINGFCTVRACRSGAKIGPLVADNTAIAHELIAHAATFFEGPITLDVPETATDLTELCARLDLAAGFKTARMYRGPLSIPKHANFAVVCLELG